MNDRQGARVNQSSQVEAILPLGPSQRMMLFYGILNPEEPGVFIDQMRVGFEGDLDPALLRRAWEAVIAHHGGLRVQFLWERRERPLQVVRTRVTLPWQESDWRELPAAAQEARLAALVAEDRRRGVDPGSAPLMRCHLVRRGETRWTLLWTFHHLILDGWSMAVVWSDLTGAYAALRAGEAPALAPAAPYSDFVAWLARREGEEDRSFWRRTLAGVEAPFALPLAPPEPLPADGRPSTRQEEVALRPEETAPLVAFVRSRGLTLNTLAQGAFALLLARYAGTDRVVYGTVASGRPPEIQGIERSVGVYMNAVPVASEVAPEAVVGDWLAALQAAQAELWDRCHAGVDEIHRWIGLPRGEALFEAMLVFENYPGGHVEGQAGLVTTEMTLREETANPFTLYVSPHRGGLRVWLTTRCDRVDRAGARAARDHFLRLLRGLAADPGRTLAEIPLLDAAEEAAVLTAGAGPAHPTPGPAPIHEAVVARAAERPEAVALVAGDRAWTYRRLETASAAVAARLRAAGAGPETVVALLAERSPELVAGLLGILRAGAAYLPLDPNVPADRLAFVLDDSGARLVLVDEGLEERLPNGGPAPVPLTAATTGEPAGALPPAAPAQLAYLIYTSGSTGLPKGVMVEHRQLASYAAVAAEEQRLRPATRVLQFASLAFDTAAEEIWPCLARGGVLVLRDDRALGPAAAFVSLLEQGRVEVVDLPTAYWHELAAQLAAGSPTLPPAVATVIIGGEKALGDRLEAWHRAVGQSVRLVNTYGPTETTVVAAAADLTGRTGPADPPIGEPIPGVRVHLLDAAGRPVPRGVTGELVIGGAGVARGYRGRPALTGERFVPDPAGPPGSRRYRSGDLAAAGPAGELRFQGRIDAQVKIRGFRIEPGEVEAGLAACAGVREAAVVPRTAPGGDLNLVAYVVPEPEGPRPGAAELRAALKQRLPDYMVPAVYHFQERLPRTASGKIDRRALPDPGGAWASGGRPFLPPRTPTEELLAQLWGELLGAPRVGVHDDFFGLGGHSLLVGRLISRLGKTLGVELPLLAVFHNPGLAELAAVIDAAAAQPGADAPILPPPIERTDRSGPIPLSFPQERVWFLHQLVPGTVAYNFQIRIAFQGPLEVPILARALTEIVRRHEVLHTVFPAGETGPVQQILAPWKVELPVIDLGRLGPDGAEAEARSLLAEEVARPFRLEALPLVRWRLLRLRRDYHQLIQVEHHFVHDGWSVSILLREMKELYEAYQAGLASPLPELPIQYADFAAWQRRWLAGEVMERLVAFWRRALEGVSAELDLPADRPRPRRSTLRGDAVRRYLPPELYRRLRAFGQGRGFTLFMTMTAGFQALLHRLTGREELLVGTGVANRRREEVEQVIGMMVNSLVLRADLTGQPHFAELLDRVRRTALDAYAHQDMPFERLVEELHPARDAARNPLFQAMFSFHDAAVPDLDFGGLKAGFLVEHNRTAKTDLNVIVAPRAEQRVGRGASAADEQAMVTWEFSTDLFDRATVERMIRHYETLLAGAVAEPERPIAELPLLTAAERAQVLVEWRGRPLSAPRKLGLAALFAQAVAAGPERSALCAGGEELSYRELADRTARLARRLRELGVGRGTPVAVALERSVELVVALLAVVEAGGLYIPLDTGYPQERLELLLADSRAAVLVTREPLLPDLPAPPGLALLCLDRPEEGARLRRLPAAALAPVAGPDDLAYVLYTSGSTGVPKGVAVPHRAIARLVLDADYVRLGPETAWLQLAPVSFDAATLEIWGPLLTGGRLVVFPPEAPSVEGIGRILARERVTHLWLTAGLFHSVAEADVGALAPLRCLLAGGDVLQPDRCRRVLEAHPGLILVNGYGPTENTTFTCCHPMAEPADAGDPVPIGRPIAGTEAWVVGPALHPEPMGVPGELVTGGEGLAQGYWSRPALSAERFVPDPFSGSPGGRLYRTGDLVRWRPGGILHFLGRRDGQVKVRGYRIEPAEVEAALLAHPAVAAAAATVRQAGEDRVLAAYIVRSVGVNGELDAALLREHVRRRLPDFMVPQAFVELPELPLDPNGKLDRRRLPDLAPVAESAHHLAPRNELEARLAELWASLLPVERVGVRDDFFDLGGHSLAATRIVARVRRDLGVEVPLGVFFDTPTVEALARFVESEGTPPASSGAGREAGTEPALAAEEDLLAAAESLSDEELDRLLEQMAMDQRS